jgi:hypothetical protein
VNAGLYQNLHLSLHLLEFSKGNLPKKNTTMFAIKAWKYSSVDLEGEETPWLKNEHDSSPSDSRAHWSSTSWYRNKSIIYAIISLFLLGLGIAFGICATIIYNSKRPWHTEEHSNLKICW